jgi:acetylornithine deacetylase/succinyl-diaminopimelate desuccinylase-like protein
MTDIVAIARQLIAADSGNPPGDTHSVAAVAADILRGTVSDVEVSLHVSRAPVTNVVARVHGRAPGRRLILNGHLDTYPVNPNLPWSVDPFAGTVRDGRLYGRGAADMKGGIAASITALGRLARLRDQWCGEVVLTLGGDEETMGLLGTGWLLHNVPHASGDAAIIADAGSPQVIRFGEKGFLWIELTATGRAAHGAHVHLGISALDRLRQAFDAIERIRILPVRPPPAVIEAIAAARAISEPLSGAGESEILQAITVNFGYCHAGSSMNLVPEAASAGADIRLPVGISTAEVETALTTALRGQDGVIWNILRRFDPSFTAPGSAIVQAVAHAAGEALGFAPAINMRVGGSDARLFRQAGIPTVVYGPTPYNIGGADEHVMIDELETVAQVQTMAALRFLRTT